MRSIFAALLTLFITAAPGWAASTGDGAAKALALVRKTYSTLTSIRAEFVQTEERPGVGISHREEGVLSFLLPDRMRWDYRGKKPHRVIINGDIVWIYMPGRHQVVRRKMTPEEMRQGAGTFLGGIDRLEKDFTVRSGGMGPEGRYALVLFPKSKKTSYDRIEIFVEPDTGVIERITIHHRIGNVTTISFAGIERNVKLSPDLFKWDIPKGTEVIEP